jgi:hypothetical protein
MWLIGFGVFDFAFEKGLIVPSDPRLYLSEHYTQRPGLDITEYTPFAPMIYSFDCLIPALDLHQEENWHPGLRTDHGPNPQVQDKMEYHFLTVDNVPRISFVREDWLILTKLYLWIHIISGWVLTSVAIVGVSRIFYKE